MSALHRDRTLSEKPNKARRTGRSLQGLKPGSMNYADWIKWIFAILIVVIIVGKFMNNRTSKASFKDVQKAVTKTVEKDDTMLDGDKNMIKRLYGLDPSEYEGVMLKYPSTNMNVNEVLLIKLKNLSQQDAVAEAIEKRLDTQKKNFDGYGTNQFSILKKSVTDIRGNYILYVVSPKTEPTVKAFEDTL